MGHYRWIILALLGEFYLDQAYLLHELIELFVDNTARVAFCEHFLCICSIWLLFEKGHNHLLVCLVLLEYVQADAQTFRLRVMKKELGQVHFVTTRKDHKHASTHYLYIADLSANEVLSGWNFDEGKARGQFMNDLLVPVLELCKALLSIFDAIVAWNDFVYHVRHYLPDGPVELI